MRLLTVRVLTAVLCLSCYSLAFAQDLKLPSVFGSHMVMQREMPVPVWGWATPDETVTVKFRDQTKTTAADADGKWMVKLDALSVGDPATLTVAGKNNEVTFDDVLVGEVWVCSGQSNMQWSCRPSRLNPDLEEIANANQSPEHPTVFQCANALPQTRATGVLRTGQWSVLFTRDACRDSLRLPITFGRAVAGGVTGCSGWT